MLDDARHSNGVAFWRFILVVLFLFFAGSGFSWAVTSKVTRHSSGADFSKGESEDVVVGSRGTIRLGRSSEVLVEEFENVWSINSIVVSAGTVYVGTSPNGGVYEYSLGELTEIYSAEPGGREEGESGSADSNSTAEANDIGVAEQAKHLANEHIFAMGTDVAGRLLVGISGERCSLCRLESGEPPGGGLKVIFEPNDAKYIFAIAVDEKGSIYLGTGPEGKIYRLDSMGAGAEVIYDSTDKNILSLAIGADGFVYAGSDSKGLVYKIDTRSQKVTVLYDSDQDEISALLIDGDSLYAAATSADVVKVERKFAAQRPSAGRPEVEQKEEEEEEEGDGESSGGMKLEIANTKEEKDEKGAERKVPPRRLPKPARASHIYRVSGEGFVDDIFSARAVFFSLGVQGGELLLGTGNSGQLYSIEPASEEESLIYEDREASQITAVVTAGEEVYIGTSNPAKLMKIGGEFSSEGTYRSDLVDAGQPAHWGKLQVEADVPGGCEVLVSCRSGNVKDVNDPTFSEWTEPATVTGPVQLDCPPGRFCQYRLVLRSTGGASSPVIREVAVASAVPNLSPKVKSVSVSRIDAAGKSGVFKISYEANDENGDKLIYEIDFRKMGRSNWIEVADEIESGSFEWDGKTVEDGRYEVRVTASDERNNTAETFLTDSRISEAVVVDNTGPVVAKYAIEKKGKTAWLKVRVSDELSMIGKFDYTVDSESKWIGVVPDDMVFDTTSEDFTLVTEELEAGEHVVAVRISDDVGNTTYKTFDVKMEGP